MKDWIDGGETPVYPLWLDHVAQSGHIPDIPGLKQGEHILNIPDIPGYSGFVKRWRNPGKSLG